MPDLDTLHEAFTELERRADAHRAVAGDPARRPSRGYRPPRLLLAVGAAVVVGGVAVAGAVVTGGDGGGRPAAGPMTTPTGPAGSVTPSGSPPPATSSRPAAPSVAVPVTTAPATSAGAGGLPGTAAELAARLRSLLAGTATFTWSALAGANAPVIGGTLTDTATHRRGGFDLQVAPGRPGDAPICEDAALSHCVIRRLASGARVSVGHETQGPATVYLVDLVRKDGAGLLMHVGNQRNPKGAGAVLSPTPPLSRTRIVALLNSPRW